MKKFIINIVLVFVFAVAISLSGTNLVFAHGPGEGGSTGSPMMFQMMEMMHGNLDKNKMMSCDNLNDAELISRGEEMMEQIMGKETHEKIEEEMEKISMKAHDDMHTMMGMWATGCVGNEMVSTMMDRYGISGGMPQQTQGQANWSAAIVGLIIGAIGGWLGNQLLRKRQ